MTLAPLLSIAPLPPGHLVPVKFGQKAEKFLLYILRYLHSGCRNEWFSTCSLLLLQKVTILLTYIHTLGFLAEISFTPLFYHPGGCLGCPEKQTSSGSIIHLFGPMFCSQNGKALKNPTVEFTYSILPGNQQPKPIRCL